MAGNKAEGPQIEKSLIGWRGWWVDLPTVRAFKRYRPAGRTPHPSAPFHRGRFIGAGPLFWAKFSDLILRRATFAVLFILQAFLFWFYPDIEGKRLPVLGTSSQI
jgi:hypothetical protein